jgi:hypothetical protein
MINISKRILIVCEDSKSSKIYFESFKKDEKLKRDLASVGIQVVHPKNHDPIGLVTRAKELKLKAQRERNPYEEIWIVLDRDGHVNIATAVDTAAANKFKVALSVICFEYWVLLHFEKTTKSFNNCDQIISYIIRKHSIKYLKCDNCFDLLKDKISIAIENGLWLDGQLENDFQRGIKSYNMPAYTNVHSLVRRLIDPKSFWLKK